MKTADRSAVSPTFTTLLFDCDGTLLDFDKAEYHSICAVMAELGLTPTPGRAQLYHDINAEYWKIFEQGQISREELLWRRFTTFFEKLGKTVDGPEVAAMYRKHLDEGADLMEGALEICSCLSGRYDLYMVTNGIAATQHKRLKLSGLDHFFPAPKVFISEDAGSQKPQKEFFDYCCERIPEKDRSRMLVIGDSLTSDIQGGINAGIPTCWLPPGSSTSGGRSDAAAAPACHTALRPDYTIHSLAELKDFL